MTFRIGRLRVGMVMIGVLGTATMFACDRPEVLTSTVSDQPRGRSSSTESSVGAIASNPVLRRQYQSARLAARPLVALHRAAMKELRDDVPAIKKELSEHGSTCNRVRSVTRKYSAQTRELGFSQEIVEAMVGAGMLHARGCQSDGLASLFTTRANTSSRTTNSNIGPFLYIYDQLVQSVIQGWDGVSDLSSDVDNAVQNMPYQYPLTMEDTEYLGALVEMAESSWGDAAAVQFADSPTATYEIGSIFSKAAWPGFTFLKRVAFIVLSDVTAFGAGFYAHAGNDNGDDGIDDSLAVGLGAAIGASGAATSSCLTDTTPCSAID